MTTSTVFVTTHATSGGPVTRFGYTLFTEDHDPLDLLDDAVAAEETGFDFVATSDHFHPWLEDHSDSAFAWSLLGAVAAQTEEIDLTTLVTAPVMRYHPAIVAQAAATIAVMSEGRFSLSVGAGERLNEHIVGQGWPGVDVRHERLREAVDIITSLWEGGYRSYDGRYFTLEDAQLFTLPEETPDLFVAVSGPRSAALAAEKGDGMVSIEPDADQIAAYREAGGDGPIRGQVTLSVYDDEDEAKDIAHQKFRFGVPGWKVMAELPNPVNFEAATAGVTPDDMPALVSCGPDPKVHLEAIEEFVEAGFDEIAVVQCGPDQEGFLEYWQEHLAPVLT